MIQVELGYKWHCRYITNFLFCFNYWCYSKGWKTYMDFLESVLFEISPPPPPNFCSPLSWPEIK